MMVADTLQTLREMTALSDALVVYSHKTTCFYRPHCRLQTSDLQPEPGSQTGFQNLLPGSK